LNTTTFDSAVQAAKRGQLIADLRAARAELMKRGRCRHHFTDHMGRVCALGAIGVALDSNFDKFSRSAQERARIHNHRFYRAEQALREFVPTTSVDTYNDDPTTTDQDILDLYEKTLASLGGLGA
jgi:hypothetical protein